MRPPAILAFILAAVPGAFAPAQLGGALDQGTQPGAGFGDSRDRVRVSAIPERAQVAPGDRVAVAVVFDHDRGWHIHTNRPQVPPELGEAEYYFATVIEAATVSGGPLRTWTRFIQWPPVETVEVSFTLSGEPVRYGVFAGKAVAYLPVTVDAGAAAGQAATVTVKAGFQACDDRVCLAPTPYPPREAGEPPDPEWLDYGIEVRFEIVAPGEAPDEAEIDPQVEALFGGFDRTVWERLPVAGSVPEAIWTVIDAGSAAGFALLLLSAALGGLLLNFTPCVLPIIPIKIMSLAQSAGQRSTTLLLGTVMSLGVVAFWLGMGGAIASIKSFTATNQLFQYPLFTIGVGLLIAVLAVGMCGVFSLRLPQAVYQVSPKLDSVAGSFLFGIMAAVLSTPCTAPFMGAAAAWATQQDRPTILTTFAAIGAGMALPYQVLSTSPALVRRMPRTGPASELIKQVMGLLMLAAAAYFAGIGISVLLVAPEEPPGRGYLWFVGGFGAAAGAWLVYKTFAITRSPVRRGVFGGLGAAILAVSAYGAVRMTDEGPIDWVYYTPERLEQARSTGDIVVMEFTAEWCLNCKALEETVLRHGEVVEILNGPGVTPIKVDITARAKSPGWSMLQAVGRREIPLLVVFAPDGTEVFKENFYTVREVLDAIEGARSGRSGAGVG